MKSYIATRTYTLDESDSVRVFLGQPTAIDERDEFQCEFEVLGLSKKINGRVVGIDAIQSLLLAMARLGSELRDSPESVSGRISWLGEDIGKNLGLLTLDTLQF